jgi:hypothetical protein
MDKKVPSIYYRQDIDGHTFPKNVFHYDGNVDSHTFNAKLLYQNQKIITCHSTNYVLLRELWPDKKIIRITPKTKIFQAIASAFYKLGPGANPGISTSVDYAFEYIKDYFNLHGNLDPLPTIENSLIIDFGDLTLFDNLSYISKNIFNVSCKDEHYKFFKEYWQLQKIPVDETLLQFHITKEDLLDIYTKIEDPFHIACFIFIYEYYNNLKEKERTWSIDNVPLSYHQLINFMQYNPE